MTPEKYRIHPIENRPYTRAEIIRDVLRLWQIPVSFGAELLIGGIEWVVAKVLHLD